MKYVILSLLLSFFMVLFPPSDVALPSQLVTETDSHVQISVYPQETDSAKTPVQTKTAPQGLSKGYGALSRMISLLSVKSLDQFIDSTMERTCAIPIQYQSNYLRHQTISHCQSVFTV
ncbi:MULTISPECIES: hypothetical protein [Bacillus amyloliquefaciens group]|uniref:hypothetical protein n=1 Tax=Bacillus amyloliquefaciens group TaxID=1938374 RepID=UPI0007A60DD2|nr:MULTISPECIES: hypothetical protein [Bacillus amyloliquefaciens group]RCX28249.1 hypothetical protein DEU43_110135 [Bacillus amyloliquefaciens]